MKPTPTTRQTLSRLLKLHGTLMRAAAAERSRTHPSGCACDFCRTVALCERGRARLQRHLPAPTPNPKPTDELPLFARLDARAAAALEREAQRVQQPLSAVAGQVLDAWVASPELRASLRLPAHGERGERTAGKVFLRAHGEAARLLKADGRKPNTVFYALLAQWADGKGESD